MKIPNTKEAWANNARMHNEALKLAISHKDKTRIIDLYDNDEIDWHLEPDLIAAEHDELVDKANSILGY